MSHTDKKSCGLLSWLSIFACLALGYSSQVKDKLSPGWNSEGREEEGGRELKIIWSAGFVESE